MGIPGGMREAGAVWKELMICRMSDHVCFYFSKIRKASGWIWVQTEIQTDERKYWLVLCSEMIYHVPISGLN